MRIVTLTERQFNNYSKIHSKKNYKQTVEYADTLRQYGYVKLYLGLIDEEDNVIGATLILEYLIKNKYKVGYAPLGYLINYNDISLFNTFTIEVRKYLIRLNYIYLRIEPNYVWKIFNKNKSTILSNTNVFQDNGYVMVNDAKKRYEAILEIEDIDKTYNNISRNLKRKIHDAKIMGVSGFKSNNIDMFYSLISKKTGYDINYFRGLRNNFKDNFEIFFAKMDPNKYLNNVQELLNKERERNYMLQERIANREIRNSKKLLDMKMKSDKIVNKYTNEVKNASKLFSTIARNDIISTCAIIKMDKTIYFIEEGFNDSYRDIHSLSTLKWELIRYYYAKGYRKFNLGVIPLNEEAVGAQFSMISFNPKIYLYPQDYDLVINKYFYGLVKKFNFIK